MELANQLKELLFPNNLLDEVSFTSLANKLREVAEQIQYFPPTQAKQEDVAGGAVTEDLKAGQCSNLLFTSNKALVEGSLINKAQQGRQTRNERRGKVREFDFSKYQTRLIALKLCYLGWDHHGFAQNADTDNTVEGHFFRAMVKAKLIPEDFTWQALQYTRCGRTDKGVSCAVQIISLRIRSKAKNTDQALPDADNELDYPYLINSILPHSIKVSAWAPIDESFHARFGAQWRHYRYFLVSRHKLNQENMQKGLDCLKGEHDFRNLCKMDFGNVKNFVRQIIEASVEETVQYGLYVYIFNIRGTAFLWRQVRCMIAVLQLIGQGLEQSNVIQWLLDLKECPAKPQFNLAGEEGLVLYDCGIDGLTWQHSKSGSGKQSKMEDLFEQQLTRILVMRTVLDKNQVMRNLEQDVQPSHSKKYINLRKRQKEPTYEERQAKRSKCNDLRQQDDHL